MVLINGRFLKFFDDISVLRLVPGIIIPLPGSSKHTHLIIPKTLKFISHPTIYLENSNEIFLQLKIQPLKNKCLTCFINVGEPEPGSRPLQKEPEQLIPPQNGSQEPGEPCNHNKSTNPNKKKKCQDSYSFIFFIRLMKIKVSNHQEKQEFSMFDQCWRAGAGIQTLQKEPEQIIPPQNDSQEPGARPFQSFQREPKPETVKEIYKNGSLPGAGPFLERAGAESR